MGSFGDRLKREREQRGITLDDIALSTKIGTRLLRALEDEKFEQLPGGIFNKGFVRAYARHLGIDEEQAISDYLGAIGQHQRTEDGADVAAADKPASNRPEVVADPRITVVRQQRTAERAAQVPWNTLAAALLILALALAGWSYYHREQQAETPKPVSPVSSQPPTSQATAPQGSSPMPEMSSAKRPAVPDRGPQDAGLKEQVPTRANNSAHAQPALTGAPAQSAALTSPTGPFTVILTAQEEDCWLLISVDGQPAVEETLFASGKRSIQANQSLVIKAGNVGTLDIFFNGKRLPLQGEFGEVRTLTFHAEGLQPRPPKAPASVQ